MAHRGPRALSRSTSVSRRHKVRHFATPLLVAIALLGCAQGGKPVPCRVPAAAPAPRPSEVTLQIDYAGAEAMVAALERESLSDAEVDSLLKIQGVSMMVDNVVQLVPGVGHEAHQLRICAENSSRAEGPTDILGPSLNLRIGKCSQTDIHHSSAGAGELTSAFGRRPEALKRPRWAHRGRPCLTSFSGRKRTVRFQVVQRKTGRLQCEGWLNRGSFRM